MQVEWYGQSAFRLEADGRDGRDRPLRRHLGLAARGMQFEYPAIDGVEADLLLVTHEHGDHNGVEVIGGDPSVLRSTAGTLDSPLGDVVGVASEHDHAAGTQRGPNTIFVFDLGGVRVAHFGDFGQTALRDEQAEAIGQVDLLFLPVGGGPTIGAEQAAAMAARIGAALDRADALPHPAHQLPRDRRPVPRADAARAPPRRARVRHRRARGRRATAGGGPRRPMSQVASQNGGHAADDRIPAYVWRISLVVIVGSIMSILDTTIVNVALATLGRELHGTIAQIQWVVTGYMLALAAVIPVTGWAARRFGAKQVYIALAGAVHGRLGAVRAGAARPTS